MPDITNDRDGTEPCFSSRCHSVTGPPASTFLERIYFFFYYLFPPLPSLSFSVWAIDKSLGLWQILWGPPSHLLSSPLISEQLY